MRRRSWLCVTPSRQSFHSFSIGWQSGEYDGTYRSRSRRPRRSSSARTSREPSGVWILARSVTTTTRRLRPAERARHASSNRQKVGASRFWPRTRTMSPVRQSVAAHSCRLGGCTPGARTFFCRPRSTHMLHHPAKTTDLTWFHLAGLTCSPAGGREAALLGGMVALGPLL